MRDMLFKKVDYTLSHLLHSIDFGDIGLPDIQRPFVWTPTRVRDLFDSMYRGFPVGYLLFWANDHLEGARSIGVGGKQQKIPGLLIVDGQQRLTSLYAVLRGKPVLNADYQEQRIHIAFRPRDGRFEVSDAAIRRDPEFIADISEVWTRGEYRLVKEYLENLRQHRPVDDGTEDTISGAISRLFDLQNYPFTALEISSSVSEEQVSEIFVRVNSQGVKLNQADFILTLLSVFWDEGRAALEAFARDSRRPPVAGSGPSPYNHHIRPDPDQLLRVAVAVGFKRGRLKSVYQLLRGKDLETEQYSAEQRDRQFAILQQAQDSVLNLKHWFEFLNCLRTAGFKSERMISSQAAVLYAYVFFLLGREEYGLEHHRLRRLIARWFFMSGLTGRYTDSPESAMDGDLARLRSVRSADEFAAILERVIQSSLTADFWDITLPNDLATSSSRSPALLAYFAALNVLSAPVLFSGMKVNELLDPAVHPARSALEKHHLFPKGFLRKIGITEPRMINQAANYALVEWGDNGAITDASPAEYFPRYAMRVRDMDLDLAAMMRFHALPEGWYGMSYEAFLEKRRQLMAGIIRDGFEKLTPNGMNWYTVDVRQ